jgi:hypothetical protein
MDTLDSWDDLPENIVEILQAEGNDTCVDCNADKPDWASLGFSVLVCLECVSILDICLILLISMCRLGNIVLWVSILVQFAA